jgi:hypothetical protein
MSSGVIDLTLPNPEVGPIGPTPPRVLYECMLPSPSDPGDTLDEAPDFVDVGGPIGEGTAGLIGVPGAELHLSCCCWYISASAALEFPLEPCLLPFELVVDTVPQDGDALTLDRYPGALDAKSWLFVLASSISELDSESELFPGVALGGSGILGGG